MRNQFPFIDLLCCPGDPWQSLKAQSSQTLFSGANFTGMCHSELLDFVMTLSCFKHTTNFYYRLYTERRAASETSIEFILLSF